MPEIERPTLEQIEDRIRHIEAVLLRAVMAGDGNRPQIRKLKTEWQTLRWVTGKQALIPEQFEDLLLSPVYQRMTDGQKRRHLKIDPQ